MFTSEESHYSIRKFGSFLGFGENNIVLIRTDDVGRMNAADLEKQIRLEIENGGMPLAVVATLGK